MSRRNKRRPRTATRRRWRLAIDAVRIVARAIRGVRLSRLVVNGPSMAPALHDGDRLLLLRLPPAWLHPMPGEIVAARPKALGGREIVKRIASVEHAGDRCQYVLLGDNLEASTDSRAFGPLSAAEISGRVLLRYWPDDRRGRVR